MPDKIIKLDLGVPNAKQSRFYDSRAVYTAYGGAKGGGKTHAVRVKAIGGALRHSGIRILILRRTYPELQANHIEPMLRLIPKEVATYNASLRTLYFVNGSTIRFGHFRSVTAEREYQGQEYDWIFIDEATQLTYREFRYLGGCLRGVSSVPKRFYITCNPGGVGHQWVKRLFIDRDYRDGENPDDYAFIFASVEDNLPLLSSSPAYLRMLESLPENLRRAYRYGDWDALGGAYFSEFSASRHVVEPFAIPRGWTLCRSFDYGLDMLACVWVATDERGRSYVYRELKASGLVVSDAAAAIRAHTPDGESITVTYAPPDMWSRQKDTGKTMAELFALRGVPVVRAGNNRIQGHMQIKEGLRDMDDGAPGLVFFSTCREAIADISAITASERNPNDCAVTPHEVTHMVDAVRYFAVSRAVSYSADEASPSGGYEGFLLGGAPSGGYLLY